MTDQDWQLLIERLRVGKCTPFLGAGVNEGALPVASEIAVRWAEEFGYPLPDTADLSRVAQFLATSRRDGLYPKDLLLEELALSPHDLADLMSSGRLVCLAAMAALPIPIYLTTNYDALLVHCLEHAGRAPIREVCRWNTLLKRLPSYQPRRHGEVSVHSPLVFHFHGTDEYRQSIVLTEDDYLDFLINVSRDERIIPARVQQALTDSSLLFIGYGLRDINFRVIYRGLVQQLEGSLRSLSVSVQLRPDDAPSSAYLEQYFGGLNVQVYWGSATDFAKELLSRWRDYHG